LFQKASSDVTFKVGNVEIPAHKEVLYEKCNFFKNMFDSKFSKEEEFNSK